MKKLNNRGFLLVETLVVTLFVIMIFCAIYFNTLPLMGEYEQRDKYDDIDSVYAADLLRSYILDHKNDFIGTGASVLSGDYINNCNNPPCRAINCGADNVCQSIMNNTDIIYACLTMHNTVQLKNRNTNGAENPCGEKYYTNNHLAKVAKNNVSSAACNRCYSKMEPWDSSDPEKFMKLGIIRGLDEYVSYIPSFKNFERNDSYRLIIVRRTTETDSGNIITRYANIEVNI